MGPVRGFGREGPGGLVACGRGVEFYDEILKGEGEGVVEKAMVGGMAA